MQEILVKLSSFSRFNEKDFQNALKHHYELNIPIPSLRAYAQEVIKEGKSLNNILLGAYLETDFLYMIVQLALQKSTIEKLKFLSEFFTKTGHWVLTDGASVKTDDFLLVKPLVLKMIKSDYPYLRRYGYVFLLENFVDTQTEFILKSLHNDEHYYVKMGQAWLLAEAFIRQKDITLPFLKSSPLDAWIINKAISKIHDSFRVSETDKQLAKTFRRKP